MGGVATAERPPRGLNAYWLGVWRHALKVLKQQDTWAWELKPLLDEYVHALIAAEQAREGFGWLDALEVYARDRPDEMEMPDWQALAKISAGLPAQWDKHTKRAAALADQLLLTERGRRAAGMTLHGDDDEPDDPFAQLDQEDELARRRNRAQAT